MFSSRTHILSTALIIIIAYSLSLRVSRVTSAPPPLPPPPSTNTLPLPLPALPALPALPTNCTCQSPSGCPGQCVLSSSSSDGEMVPSCANYCGTGTVLPCASCVGVNGNGTGVNATGTGMEMGMEIVECIYDFADGSCFTIS